MANSCLSYMRARYYDPEVGRFISEDPIGFEGGTVNLYEYVKNDPVRFIDPRGLDGFGDDHPLVSLGLYGPTHSDIMRDRNIPPSNVSVMAGGIFHVAGIGAGAFTGFAIDSNFDICLVTTVCGSVGWGLYGQIGLSGSLGSGDLCEGESDIEGGFVELGGGWLGGNILSDDDNDIQTGRAIAGPGGGYAAGYMGCHQTTFCFTK